MGNSITRNDRQHRIEESQQSGEDTSQSELTKASRKVSVWSLGSLSSRLNWSFSGSRSSSVSLPKFNNKSQRKRSSNFSRQYSKTTWPTRYTDAIFLSHFKRFSRNDEFSIKHTIAKGAFGIVFKVVNKKTPEFEYALKVLRKSKIIEENSVQQIKDEVDIQKLCGHHPFVVKQIDSWQNRSNLHILSEYIPQGELFNKITKFSYDLVRIYVAELALAIDFLHNAGVIYRDVKPENILLTSSFHIKITDFGLSKWLKLGERTRTMCGTFQYMAPEIFHGKLYGHSVDWWALGVVACRMLTNKYPNTVVYIGDCEIVSSYYADNQPEDDQFFPREIEDLPAAGRDLLIRLLEIDPKTRIKSVLGLQKIAMYKDFNINIKFLQEISPLEIIEKSSISLNVVDNNEAKSNNDDFREF